FSLRSSSGYFDGEVEWTIDQKPAFLASNLGDFLEPEEHQPLSAQASAGLVVCFLCLATPIPPQLFVFLSMPSLERGRKIHPSRGDSFSALAEMLPEVIQYRNKLDRLAKWGGN